MFKYLFILFFGACSIGYGRVESVFNSYATGTTSATVFVPKGEGFADVRDLSYRHDTGVTTAFIAEHIGRKQYAITSSTASAASVLWITNTNTEVAVGEFIILYDDSAGDYYLRRVSAATTTSISLYSSISITTTTSDLVWGTHTVVQKPSGNVTSATGGGASLWLPALFPSALVIDGNTTSCTISISGSRGAYQ